MPRRRLFLAYVASLLLHLAALGSADLMARLQRPPARPTPAMLEATLLPAPAPREAEPLIKDTLAEATATAAAAPPQNQAPGARQATPRAVTAAAQRKLAEHLFYPEDARIRGLEGEVRLLLTLETDGTLADAQVAGSSGHEILDGAAVRAAYAMGRLPGIGRREIILPVVFRLSP